MSLQRFSCYLPKLYKSEFFNLFFNKVHYSHIFILFYWILQMLNDSILVLTNLKMSIRRIVINSSTWVLECMKLWINNGGTVLHEFSMNMTKFRSIKVEITCRKISSSVCNIRGPTVYTWTREPLLCSLCEVKIQRLQIRIYSTRISVNISSTHHIRSMVTALNFVHIASNAGDAALKQQKEMVRKCWDWTTFRLNTSRFLTAAWT